MSDGGTLRIAGFAGSLRKGSFNRALLRTAAELGPAAGLEIAILEVADIPLYNADVEAAGMPEPVRRLREAVGAAAGLLIATPEYNSGTPAVTKNTVDWLSRPPKPSPLDGRAAAIMGASPGGFGTVRSQLQLRQVLHSARALTMPHPEIMVSRANEKFDAAGALTDLPTREALAKFLAAFGDWIRRLK